MTWAARFLFFLHCQCRFKCLVLKHFALTQYCIHACFFWGNMGFAPVGVNAPRLLWLGTGVFLALLIYQHLLVKANDLSKVNLAFFTTNGIASLLFDTMAIIDLLT